MLHESENNNETNKENNAQLEKPCTDVTIKNETTRTRPAAAEFFSPPKKKLKQDSIPFQKILKDDALQESQRLVEPKSKTLSQQDLTPSKENAEKQAQIQFPKVQKDEAVQHELKHEKKKSNDEVCVNKDNEESSVDQLVDEPIQSAEPTESQGDALQLNHVKTPEQKQDADKSKKKSPAAKQEKQKAKDLKEQQKLARQKELEEKKKQKEEERLLKQSEREKREEEKKEKERQKEEEKKRKDEEKRKRDEQKEAEKKKKEELKEIEREKKESERKQKEEQKKQEEEKKRLEEEATRRKKEKAANQFKSFFTKKVNTMPAKKPEEETYQRFKPFQLKPNMLMAPISRKSISHRELLDRALDNSSCDLTTYLEDLAIHLANNKKLPYITRRKLRKEYEEKRKLEMKEKKEHTESIKSKAKEKNTCSPPQVILIEDNSNDASDEEEGDELDGDTSFCKNALVKVKLLQFSENTRPGYFGTWRKKTKFISGRKPFGLDSEIFNYDIDSDEDWIDEPGEDCSDNNVEEEEGDLDKETEDDDDGFFVPHGYLSDDEGVKDSDEEEDNEGENDNAPLEGSLRNSNENREQEKLKAKVCSFETGFKKKFKPRKPICIGVTYGVDNIHPLLVDYERVELFMSQVEEVQVNAESQEQTPGCKKVDAELPEHLNQTPQTVPDEAMEFLIRFLHGNSNSVAKMREEFKSFWAAYVKKNNLDKRVNISKRQFERKVQAIATRSHNADVGKVCYTINPEILSQYDLTDIKLCTGLPCLMADSPAEEKQEQIVNQEAMEIDPVS